MGVGHELEVQTKGSENMSRFCLFQVLDLAQLLPLQDF